MRTYFISIIKWSLDIKIPGPYIQKRNLSAYINRKGSGNLMGLIGFVCLGLRSGCRGLLSKDEAK